MPQKPIDKPPHECLPDFAGVIEYGYLEDYGYEEPPRKWWYFFIYEKTMGFIVPKDCLVKRTFNFTTLYIPEGVNVHLAQGVALNVDDLICMGQIHGITQ